MTRIPPAATQFIKEVQQVDEDVTAGAGGEPDGFGRYRSIRFGGATDWLGDVLRSMWNEPRLQEWYEVDGDIVLTFVGSVKADRADEFGVKKAAEVLRKEEPKKAPAKKATKKATKKSQSTKRT